MITLHGYPRTRTTRVAWLLEELGLDWQYQLVDLAKGEHRGKAFRSLNPRGRVPALHDSDSEALLTESVAICLYLAERYGNGQWLPQPGSAESGRHHQWLSLITAELEQALWLMGKHKFVLPPELRIPVNVQFGADEFAKLLSEVDDELPEQGFLLGDRISVADILMAQTLNWAQAFKLPLTDKAESFRARMYARPAMQRVQQREAAVLSDSEH
ncbi:glutathione S-transferase family protein [Ferrimonas pelagia]|uniref:Glutathione S-transferase family protein n=1 Tax=Ferrimonas pelagia TaxID=1177826 RepID=A0ABP9FDE2_9GAMM